MGPNMASKIYVCLCYYLFDKLNLHLFIRPKYLQQCLVWKQYKKVTAFEFKQNYQALCFHITPFGSRAQIITVKETFQAMSFRHSVHATAKLFCTIFKLLQMILFS